MCSRDRFMAFRQEAITYPARADAVTQRPYLRPFAAGIKPQAQPQAQRFCSGTEEWPRVSELRQVANRGWLRERCVSRETKTNTTKPSGIVTMAGWLNGTRALAGSRL